MENLANARRERERDGKRDGEREGRGGDSGREIAAFVP